MLACASTDTTISILSFSKAKTWTHQLITKAHEQVFKILVVPSRVERIGLCQVLFELRYYTCNILSCFVYFWAVMSTILGHLDNSVYIIANRLVGLYIYGINIRFVVQILETEWQFCMLKILEQICKENQRSIVDRAD